MKRSPPPTSVWEAGSSASRVFTPTWGLAHKATSSHADYCALQPQGHPGGHSGAQEVMEKGSDAKRKKMEGNLGEKTRLEKSSP